MQRCVALVLFALAAVAWAVALFIAVAPTAPYAATLVYAVGSLICHQIPERSFHLAGVQLPVCARCTGLYVGAAIGAVLWMMSRSTRVESPRTARRALIVAAAPTIMTVLTAMAGLWDPGNAIRATLAAPLGMTVSGVVMAVLAGHLR